MPREALRLAAGSGDNVDVDVAGVFAAESDGASVWREVWIRRLPVEAGQAPRRAAGALDDPDVVRVRERDLRGADGGRTQQPGTLVIGRQRGAVDNAGDQQCDGREREPSE